MTARLKSFQYLPKPQNGWQTPLLEFGAVMTVLESPNGSGKTPVMKGIFLALGHELELPPDITEHCLAARLELLVDSQPVTLTRWLSKPFRMTVADEDGTRDLSESEYASWFTKMLGGDAPTLTNKQDKPAVLYANAIIPSFAVDQDHGWNTDYYVPRNRDFIKSQRQEVIRFLMGVRPRHPFRTKTEFEEAKKIAERIDRLFESQKYLVDRLRAKGELRDDEEPGLLARQLELQKELASNSQAVEALREITSFVERDISRLEAQRDALLASAGGLSRQRGQLSLVLSQLDGEVEVLAANVQATDVLRHFCGRTECALFGNSAQSYGRSLLYLKDQMKDLSNSVSDISGSEAAVAEQITLAEHAIAEKRAERDALIARSPQAQLMAKLNALTQDIVNTELRLANFQQYVSERAQFEKLLDRRTQAHEAVEALRPRATRGDNEAVDDLRRELTDSIQQWIETLRTENTKAVGFDDDFAVYTDTRKFATDTHHSGDTRARIVLAFHAALLEVALARGGNHPGWLLLDAPQQHELSQNDFEAYAERLKMLADRYPGQVQLVFSVANRKLQIEVRDELWIPEYANEEGKPRFLGPM